MNDTFHISASEQLIPHPKANEGAPALTGILTGMESTLETAVGRESPLINRLRALRDRLKGERLQLAVLGQFKRGKSTFINALLGAAVLPTGVVPLTAVATFIAWGREPLVVIHFKGDKQSEEFASQTIDEIRDALFRFVAEEANPANRLGVDRVELFYPSDILADGTVVIDTPGVGSTLRHNTEAALEVLPECDAAFFVTSADPPITETELEFLRQLKSKMARILLVLNKVDYLWSDERHRVVEFLQRVLADNSLIELGKRIFCISAREGLNAKRSGDKQALVTSGIAELENSLVHVSAGEKRHWLENAVRRKAADIAHQASAEIALRVRAMNMPVEELATKLHAFLDALLSIEEQRRVTRDLLAGDHRRLREALDSRIGDLRSNVAGKLSRAIDTSLSDGIPTAWAETARRAVAQAMQDEFDAARAPLVTAFAAEAGAALHRCQERVNALVDRVRHTAAEILDVPLGPDIERESFELGEDPYWVTESVAATLIPDPSQLVDRVLPSSLRRPRLRARMTRQAQELIVRNGENLRWAILRGLDETFRKATLRFEERLDEAIEATRSVIKDALARRQDQAFAVQPELDRLAGADASLALARQELEGHLERPFSGATTGGVWNY
jgi:GTPase Era involved in 16S rRNA processing